MGKVIAIATRPKTKAPMETCSSAVVSFDKGVGSDSRGLKRNHRQVTVITIEGWSEACNELNAELPWATRRANILIGGIDLANTKGKFLKVGNFYLEITGELEPCNRMDEQHNGLTNALKANWRGGVTCKLLSEGNVAIDDDVSLLESIN